MLRTENSIVSIPLLLLYALSCLVIICFAVRADVRNVVMIVSVLQGAGLALSLNHIQQPVQIIVILRVVLHLLP